MINQTEQTCPTVAYQMSSVCVPVKVTPYARTGATFTKCCGNATVTPGIAVCDGVKNGFAHSPSVRTSASPYRLNSALRLKSEMLMSAATALPPMMSAPIAVSSP